MEWNVIRVLDHCSMEQGPSKDIDIASLITAIYYGIEGIMVVNRPFIRPRVLPSLEKKNTCRILLHPWWSAAGSS